MTWRIGWLGALGALLAVEVAAGQVGPVQGPAAVPRSPAAQPPSAAAQGPQVPFRLTSQEEANLDWVLNAWQQQTGKVKSLSCDFTRWEYDLVFGTADKPTSITEGVISYRAPDKGAFWVKKPEEQQQRWICDGTSVYEYNYAEKQLVQHKLPPELHGKAIVDSPLPFIFGADAAKLKQRYFLRVITPPDVQGKQTWLEAYPRYQQDAANFARAELILTNETMAPYALQMFEPNGQSRSVYQFRGLKTNDPLDFLTNSYQPLTPPFWKKVVEEAPAAQVVGRPGASGTQ